MHTWVDSEKVGQFIRDCEEVAAMSQDVERYVNSRRMAPSACVGYRAAAAKVPEFRYGYLARLLDDSELRDLEGLVRRQTRLVHRKAFWKSVSLLKRDAAVIFRNQRRLMCDEGAWDFSELTRSRARTSVLVCSLRAAYVGHFLRLPAATARISRAIAELSSILVPLSPALATTA